MMAVNRRQLVVTPVQPAGGHSPHRPDPGAGWIALQIADGAYRYGQGQVRDRYQVNRHGEPVPLLHEVEWQGGRV
jgi:hypothetical protein